MEYRERLLALLAEKGYGEEQLFEGVQIPVGKGTIEARLTDPKPDRNRDTSSLRLKFTPETSWRDVIDDPSHLKPGDYVLEAYAVYEPNGNVFGIVETFPVKEHSKGHKRYVGSREFRSDAFDVAQSQRIELARDLSEFFIQFLSLPIMLGSYYLAHKRDDKAQPPSDK